MSVRSTILLGAALLLSLLQPGSNTSVNAQPTCLDCGGDVIVCGASPAVCRLGIQCQAAQPMDCCLTCTNGSCRHCLRA
jgi:hypothetical protein